MQYSERYKGARPARGAVFLGYATKIPTSIFRNLIARRSISRIPICRRSILQIRYNKVDFPKVGYPESRYFESYIPKNEPKMHKQEKMKLKRLNGVRSLLITKPANREVGRMHQVLSGWVVVEGSGGMGLFVVVFSDIC